MPAFVYSETINAAGKGNRVSHDLMHAVDWYPTLVRLAGGSLVQPLPLDGVDIWPTITEVALKKKKKICFALVARVLIVIPSITT